MREASRRILRYTAGTSKEDLWGDEILRDALIRQFTVLGEAATRISRTLRDRNSDVPWQRIIGMRNVVVHQYDRVLLDTIWDAVTTDVPALVPRLDALLPPESGDT
jgi:uncharacterized protein with HEPN domain